jgi:hypothetical protein
MDSGAFDKPAMVNLRDAHGGHFYAEVHNPREAVAAMEQHALGKSAVGSDLWTMAFTLLTRAVEDSTLQNRRVAQVALEVLAAYTATRH